MGIDRESQSSWLQPVTKAGNGAVTYSWTAYWLCDRRYLPGKL